MHYRFDDVAIFKVFVELNVDVHVGYTNAINFGKSALRELVILSDPKKIDINIFKRLCWRFACDDDLDTLKFILNWPGFSDKVEYDKIIINNIYYAFNRNTDRYGDGIKYCPPEITMHILGKLTNNNPLKSLEKLVELNNTVDLNVLERGCYIVKELIEENDIDLKLYESLASELLINYCAMCEYEMVMWLINKGVNPVNKTALMQAELSTHPRKDSLVALLLEFNDPSQLKTLSNKYEIKRRQEKEEYDKIIWY